jgi:MFS family permease
MFWSRLAQLQLLSAYLQYMALISQIVPGNRVGRASGLMQLGPATAQILSPVLAATLIGVIGYHGIFLLDGASFIFAIITLLRIQIPQLAAYNQHPEKKEASLLREGRKSRNPLYSCVFEPMLAGINNLQNLR